MREDRNTRPVLYVDPVAHRLEDPPMKRTDWKGLAVMITAVVGALGFFWNAGKGCYDAGQTQATQAASYDALAGKVEALYVRIGVLEEVLRMLPSLFTKKAPEAERMVGALPLPKGVGATHPEVDMAAPPAPPSHGFQKSGLPTFQKLQQRVKGE